MMKPTFLPTDKELKQLVNAHLYKEIYHDYKNVRTGKLSVQKGFAHSIKLIKKSRSRNGHIMIQSWHDGRTIAPFYTRKQVIQQQSHNAKTAYKQEYNFETELGTSPNLAKSLATDLKHKEERILNNLKRSDIEYFMDDDNNGYKPANYHCFDLVLDTIASALENELARRHPDIGNTEFLADNDELNATTRYLTHHVLTK